MAPETILRDLAVIFVVAKLAGALFERFRQSAVVGELLAGILIGPHVLGWIGHSEVHSMFAELGAIVLLFAVGLDTPLSDLRAVGRHSLAVGVSGVILPFAAGAALLLAAGYPGEQALFLGTAMVATSVGVTARVLRDLGLIDRRPSRVILGAAVVDDVLGLLVLAVVLGAVTTGVSGIEIATLGGLAICFVVLVGGLGARLVARAQPVLDRIGRLGVFTTALALCLGLSALAGALQLAAIIGAFLAGMAFAETHDRYKLEEQLVPVYSFLVPFFFCITGALVDPSVLMQSSTAWLAAVVVVVAIGTKLLGCGLAALPLGRRDAVLVGIGMVPRGEVGILVASIGLARGIVDERLYAVVILMSVTTTLVVPPVLAKLTGRRPGPPPEAGVRTQEVEGVGG